MGKRRADADSRRFFDEFESVRVSRFRAMGVIDPAKRQALIPFPNGKVKLIGTAHVRFPNGGGWSYFLCPKCAKLAVVLHLVDDTPLCSACCEALNIRHASAYGFGRETRRRAQDRHLDQLVARLETKQPLKLKPAPSSWGGKAQIVYNGRKLTNRMRRRMITLRLNQLANQQASSRAGDHDVLTTYRPKAEALQTIDITPIWRANTAETLQQALDAAQCAILAALESDDPQQRLNAAKLLLNTKQARDRGL
jgi:hypothetical protein